MSEHSNHHEHKSHGVHDPVCKMSVDPQTADYSSQHAGKTWYFCSSGCQSKFDNNPEKYLSEENEQTESVASGTMFTCPMHPEIRQQGQGECPICGMSLEPEAVSLDDGPSEELAYMTRRFWIGLALALPVFLIEMGGHLFNIDHIVSPQTSCRANPLPASPLAGGGAGWFVPSPCVFEGEG